MSSTRFKGGGVGNSQTLPFVNNELRFVRRFVRRFGKNEGVNVQLGCRESCPCRRNTKEERKRSALEIQTLTPPPQSAVNHTIIHSVCEFNRSNARLPSPLCPESYVAEVDSFPNGNFVPADLVLQLCMNNPRSSIRYLEEE
jgi:hypothetical protein